MKIIKLSEEHYVGVDGWEIKEGDYYISWMSGRVLQRTKTMDNSSNSGKNKNLK